jgi:nucleoside-diphosphate-sugar epimerase
MRGAKIPAARSVNETPDPGDSTQQSADLGNVLVTGASSQIGQCVVRRLCAAHRPVIALGRGRPQSSTNPHLRFIQGDLETSDVAFPQSLGMVVHIAAIWLLPEHLDALYARGVRRIVCFSSTSIFIKQASSNAGERDLVVRMKAAETEIAARCQALGIVWTALRSIPRP